MIPSAWHGELVTLRDVEPDDWEAFYAFDQDTEASRFGWQIHFPRSKAAAKEWAEELAKKKPENDNHFFAMVGPEGKVVGSMNAHACDRRNGTFEYGISVDRECWGKGYAADAMKVLLRYYFDELGYAKVHAIVYAYNDRSIRMHEKFGMVREGQLREAKFTDGKRYDMFIFGMTADEFRARHPASPPRLDA
jgi:RimJ/RimL family protein N-acetyltransferase